MTAEILLSSVTAVIFFLLTFIALVNPLGVNVTANRWFSVFLFTAGCMLINSIVSQLGLHQKYHQLEAFGELSRFAMAPALYLGVLHFASPDKKIKLKELWHFVPFVIFFICMLPAIFGFKPFIINAGWLAPFLRRVLEFLFFFCVKIQLLIYFPLSWFALKRHRRNIKLINSNINSVSLNWLNHLLIGIGLMILLFFVDVARGELHILPMAISPALYFIGSLFICYFLLAQKEVYPFEEPELQEIDELISTPQKTTKQRLSDTELEQLKAKLLHLMKDEKVYLDNELDLPALANQMEISIHDLSYLLNEGFEMNFFRFVNTYRVEEAKQLMLLEKYRHLNILGIAYSAGFNSKSTFNAAFKKETGIAPSQFIQQVKEGAVVAASV